MLRVMTVPVDESAAAGRCQPLRTAVFERLAAGDHGGALPCAVAAAELFPEKGEVPIWLACIHSRLGEPRAAVAALRGGLERGLCWPEGGPLDDDDLEPLRGRADFAAAVRDAAAAAARAPEHGPLTPVVLSAFSAEGRRPPRALLVALHGWGQDADEFALHWEATAAGGVAVVAPRSSQEPCPGFHVWDDRGRALDDVASQLSAGRVLSGGTAATPLVLAGFSQGGGVAVDLALDGLPAPSGAVLTLAAGLSDLAGAPPVDRLAAAAAAGLRARLLVGAGDDALEDVRLLARAGWCRDRRRTRGASRSRARDAGAAGSGAGPRGRRVAGMTGGCPPAPPR
jgi:hypothetical protein